MGNKPQYVELHASSAFSCLEGASAPEHLVDRAAELGLPAIAVADRNGIYGAARFHSRATSLLGEGPPRIEALIGAEVSVASFGLRAAPPAYLANRVQPEPARLTLLCSRGLARAAEEQGTPLAQMTTEERLVADFGGTGLTTGPHPMSYKRADLRSQHILSAVELARTADGSYVRAAGCVIARQRQGTASGFIFLSMEDEPVSPTSSFTRSSTSGSGYWSRGPSFCWSRAVCRTRTA